MWGLDEEILLTGWLEDKQRAEESADTQQQQKQKQRLCKMAVTVVVVRVWDFDSIYSAQFEVIDDDDDDRKQSNQM